ncbi:MAG: dipeptidase [Desulfobacterales bacterium]|nr:dipeptidase [Desulfobacterales bacterium]
MTNSPILIDLTAPLATLEPFLDNFARGGVTALAATVGYGTPGLGTPAFTLNTLGTWLNRFRDRADLLPIRRAADIEKAHREGKLGIIFHFQGSLPMETDVTTLSAYHGLGLRIFQLCYNTRDHLGCGCAEETDTGLTDLGRQAIQELNRLGILIDCAHTGITTTRQTLELSQAPVIISHGNAAAVCPSARNLDDDTIKAVADTGGVVGVNGFPAFVTPSGQPSLDQFMAHIRHMVHVAGEDHVALGLDYFEYQDGAADLETATQVYDYLIQSKAWNTTDYPPPPWKYPMGIEMPEKLITLPRALEKAGFTPAQVEKILGCNALRVFKDVWH